MSILDKLFKKRQPKTNSIPFTELESATDGFKVVLKTEKNLSEEQRNTIIIIVKNGMASNSEPSDICINIMMSTGIYDVMILNRIENGFDLERGKSSSREHLSVKDYLEEKANKEYNKKVFKKSYLNDNGYVCFNIDSSILKPDYVFHKFNQILKNNNLRPIRFNDLRHSWASLLLSNKVSMKDIQIWLGHSSYNTTANIYTHVDIELK